MGYVTVQAMRDEGVTDPPIPDAKLQAIIDQESRRIDQVTGQFFEPRPLTLLVDGEGSRRLNLHLPIISVDTVKLVDSDGVGMETFDESSYRVYNRHISQELLNPDDRRDPRIEFVRGSTAIVGDVYRQATNRVFASGSQNVEVDGMFGYTDPDPNPPNNPNGVTPLLIQHATKLLVMKELIPLADADERFAARFRNRIQSLRTRDQAITYAAPRQMGARGYLTGDEEVDAILENFMAALDLGRA